jgi:hypothetical protein
MEDRFPRAEALLKAELAEASPTNEPLFESFTPLSALVLGSLFVTSLFLRSVFKPLIDDQRLRKQNEHPSDREARSLQMQKELRSLSFLSQEIVNASSRDLRTYFNRTVHFIHVLVGFIQAEPLDRFREIATTAMKLIDLRSRELDAIPHNAFS